MANLHIIEITITSITEIKEETSHKTVIIEVLIIDLHLIEIIIKMQMDLRKTLRDLQAIIKMIETTVI